MGNLRNRAKRSGQFFRSPKTHPQRNLCIWNAPNLFCSANYWSCHHCLPSIITCTWLPVPQSPKERAEATSEAHGFADRVSEHRKQPRQAQSQLPGILSVWHVHSPPYFTHMWLAKLKENFLSAPLSAHATQSCPLHRTHSYKVLSNDRNFNTAHALLLTARVSSDARDWTGQKGHLDMYKFGGHNGWCWKKTLPVPAQKLEV